MVSLVATIWQLLFVHKYKLQKKALHYDEKYLYRVSLEVTILEFLSAGDSKTEILNQYPTLVPEDIDACLRYAADLMGHQFSFKAIK